MTSEQRSIAASRASLRSFLRSASALCVAALAALGPRAADARPLARPAAGPQGEAELAELLDQERREADRLRRRGELRDARRILSEHLEDDPGDVESRALLARVRWDESEPERALEEAREAFQGAVAGHPEEPAHAPRVIALCARTLGRLLVELGRPEEALAALEGQVDPTADPRSAWSLARAYGEAGRREDELSALRAGGLAREAPSWEERLAKARCLRGLGRLERSSQVLVEADALAAADAGTEPDVLVELAGVYFEADGEVELDDPALEEARSPARLYEEALRLHPSHLGALLGEFDLRRFNWRRHRRSPAEVLARCLELHPRSVDAHVAALSADIDDGRLPSAREHLARLEELAPRRRDVRAEKAALYWIEHRREEAEALLDELVEGAPHDSRPERVVATHLLELYRFAEGLPFARRAVERDPDDHEAWTQLGRALANTGDEPAAREAFERAEHEADGRQNAWRNNTALVLERMAKRMTESTFGDITFVWRPDAEPVLSAYLPPFYEAARAELAARYGYTPGPVRIEVFRRWVDFSVRSTGFEGFPAYGVCFGPVVTAVSPLAPELRGTFSWARTAFHEFTHVIHLGLSHNRCPRWVTEGLATWEEVARRGAWTRNMRKDLYDARANGAILPVRELNRAFRGPRITFAYYQSGLLMEMLIEEHGFSPVVRLLEAFDRGLDLDRALDAVYGASPEELDREFARFVDARLADLAIEPRWEPATITRTRIALSREPPEEGGEAARREWADGWVTIAWGAWQDGRRIDAEEALRRADRSGVELPRALFLRGEMALAAGDEESAVEHWERGLEGGGGDYRVRFVLGELRRRAGDEEAALEHWLAAEEVFPGYPERALSAELALARLHEESGREEDAIAAHERWLRWNSGDGAIRLRLARHYAGAGEHERAAELFRESNEVDPFRRALHRDWARTLLALERWEEALREAEVALAVPLELDAEAEGPLSQEERAELVALAARALAGLGRVEEARERAREALALDSDQVEARAVLEGE